MSRSRAIDGWRLYLVIAAFAFAGAAVAAAGFGRFAGASVLVIPLALGGLIIAGPRSLRKTPGPLTITTWLAGGVMAIGLTGVGLAFSGSLLATERVALLYLFWMPVIVGSHLLGARLRHRQPRTATAADNDGGHPRASRGGPLRVLAYAAVAIIPLSSVAFIASGSHTQEGPTLATWLTPVDGLASGLTVSPGSTKRLEVGVSSSHAAGRDLHVMVIADGSVLAVRDIASADLPSTFQVDVYVPESSSSYDVTSTVSFADGSGQPETAFLRFELKP